MYRAPQLALFIPIAAAFLLMAWNAPSGAESPSQWAGAPPVSGSSQAVPPFYNSEKEAKPFPRLLSPDRFRDYPVVARAYKIANAMPGVVAQQPCYCWCEGKFGHKSLLGCYTSDHGAG